ncbi:transposase [Shimia sp.]|uniref:transposase n=1 Tax=Shimia sp. TaxID=1954381 RepID=UPI003BAAAEF9
MAKRREFTDQFKAKVALEALRGEKSVQEIAAKYKLHTNQANTWKRQAIDGIADVFSFGTQNARQKRRLKSCKSTSYERVCTRQRRPSRRRAVQDGMRGGCQQERKCLLLAKQNTLPFWRAISRRQSRKSHNGSKWTCIPDG